MSEGIMIKKFSVKNFKNFDKKIELDFSKTRDYGFNQYLVKSNLLNKMLIYGNNNSGKSNFGAAMMDITRHLTDNGKSNSIYNYYINGNSINDVVEFKYEFIFNNQNIIYSYKKNKIAQLIDEVLEIDGILVFNYNYKNDKFINNIEGANTINMTNRNRDMSALKYVYNNTMFWADNNPVKLLMEFVNNMLWFRALKYNEFMGVMPNSEDLNDFIINNRLMKEFEKFLRNCGQDYSLCEISESGKKVIGVKYKNFIAAFNSVASTGTLTLWVFFYWMNRTTNISFIYLDEFDAFYHYELSKYILNYVNQKESFQSVLTSHNTYLVSNELMRPDCYFILENGSLNSFAECTNKTIRQAHNLEKMMLGGEFEK